MALEARAAAEVTASQLHGAQREVQSSRRRTHDAELSAAAKSEALEEATLQMHQLQVFDRQRLKEKCAALMRLNLHMGALLPLCFKLLVRAFQRLEFCQAK